MMVASDHLLHMPAILDRLPKDIVILDRQHHHSAAFPTVTFLRARGFEVIGCAAGRCDHLRALIVDGRRRGMAGVLDTVGESADRPLCLAAPGIYLMDRLARGEPSVADDTLLAAAEELIWPGIAPGIAWRMLFDHHHSLPPALRAKVKADAALALRRAVPYRRFAWIAEELRRLLEA
jgi:hypothetical protein